MFFVSRIAKREIPALVLAVGLGLFSVNTPVLADEIKNLGQEIENLKGKIQEIENLKGEIQELENKYKSILEHSSASGSAKASKPAKAFKSAASAIAVGTKLNGAQIKSLFSGKSIERISDGSCHPFQIDFEKNGNVKVTCNVNSDNGKWFTNDDMLGLEMDNYWFGKPRYYTITKAEADTVVAKAISGGGANALGKNFTWEVY